MKNVNILLPTYNGEKYLPSLLDSLKAQTYPNIWIYARDDGSTDSTLDILRGYESEFNGSGAKRRLIIANDIDRDYANLGPHENYHRMIELMGDADYYFFCDQDDVWSPNKVNRAVRLMEKCPIGVPVLYTHNYYICDGDLKVKGTLTRESKRANKIIGQKKMARINLSKVIMTGTYAGVGMAQGFNHELKRLAFELGDTSPQVAVDCWISWVVAGMDGILIYDSKPLAKYRRHSGVYSAGGALGLGKYKDWLHNSKRHLENIALGIRDYERLYIDMVSPRGADFLMTFSGPDRMGKFLYPHRLRKSLLDEAIFRVLALLGAI